VQVDILFFFFGLKLRQPNLELESYCRSEKYVQEKFSKVRSLRNHSCKMKMKLTFENFQDVILRRSAEVFPG